MDRGELASPTVVALRPAPTASTVQSWRLMLTVVAQSLGVTVALVTHGADDAHSEMTVPSRTAGDPHLEPIVDLDHPVRWPDGEVYATICVLHSAPRDFSPTERGLLLSARDVVEASLAGPAPASSHADRARVEDAVLEVGPNGIISRSSPTMDQLLGAGRAVVGRPYDEVLGALYDGADVSACIAEALTLPAYAELSAFTVRPGAGRFVAALGLGYFAVLVRIPPHVDAQELIDDLARSVEQDARHRTMGPEIMIGVVDVLATPASSPSALVDIATRQIGVVPHPSDAPSTSTVLTAREKDVANLVAQGLTNREIAHRLVISVRTVEGHVEHIRDKLNLSSRTQLAARVLRDPTLVG